MFGDPGEHLRAYLFSVMKCKDVVRPTGTGQDTMRSAVLPLDGPTDVEQGSKHMLCSC